MKLRNVLAAMLLVLACAGVLVAHVWKQNLFVEMSRESFALRKQITSLRDAVASAELEAGELRKSARLERLGQEMFGLAYGGAPVTVYGRAPERKQGPLAKLAFWKQGMEWSGRGL